ncbi:MAG: DNA-directed DNA polymerase [Candidatus Dojkabacteria bacterium]|nr:MAG: DNA-directed DNA polymerase [Candidatus Dojkabacteria bacterium]
MAKQFTHLHVHTHYSLLDGVNTTYHLLEKVKNSGMEAIAITDHGVLYGVPEFWKTSKDFGIKPILGCEIYLSPKKHTLKQPVNGIKYYHLLLLAKNLDGYKNLIKIVTKAHVEGFYYKPRIDIETLKKYSENLICTSACLASPIARHIIRNQEKIALDWMLKLKDIFKEDFYLELQRHVHHGSDEIDEKNMQNLSEDAIDLMKKQIKVNKKLKEWSEKYNIPLIATTDAHYLDDKDKEVQSVLFCIKDGLTLTDERARKGYIGTYIKTPEEMYQVYADDHTPLINTMEIADKVEIINLKPDRVQPKFWNLPKNKSSFDELREQTFERAKQKFGDNLSDEIVERLENELYVINKMGYSDYFLVVGDIMQYARRSGIVVGVRGSAAGSLVSYCLGITNVDPIKWGLVFERFLNLERASPPDIDMDIEDDERDKIVEYVKEKYGKSSVAAIITFGKMTTKAAIRDAARVMGIDLQTADKLSKMVTVLFGKPFSWDKMMETDPDFKNLVESDERLQKLGEIVRKIDGLNRHTGVHAAGYLITPGPLDEFMAYQIDTKNPDLFVTQMDGTWIDKLDFMKFDFLGLRTLTIIKNAILYIKDRHGIDINLEEINVNPTQGEFDPKALEIFQKGETVGVFQFESPPMQKYLVELSPKNLEDICFMAAAYRPGPMQYIPSYIEIRQGKKEPEYLIPELEEILKDTLGFPVYQEQLLKICQKLGGFSLGDGDVIRNALKKKQLEILKAKEEDFKKYFLEHFDYGPEIADKIWAQLEPFASYGFNKAHAASYAAVAYWCAYLKGNYPLEFITALMHSDLENTDRITIDIKDAKRLGFKILPPDINKSDIYFLPEGDNSIRFGLGAIKNVGTKVCKLIIEERQKNGEYKSLDELIFRVGTGNINKKACECLIQAGAMDSFGDRKGLLSIIPEVYEKVQKREKQESLGQSDLFSVLSENPTQVSIEPTKIPENFKATSQEKLNWERELMGVFISSHPLDQYKWINLNAEFCEIENVLYKNADTKVKIPCVISDIKITHTKKDNRKMLILTLEDKSGAIGGIIFPNAYSEISQNINLENGMAVIVEGTINQRDDEKTIIINAISLLSNLTPPDQITINIIGVKDKQKLENLKSIFSDTGDLKITIVYGTTKNPKHIFKYTKLTEHNVAILNDWITKY